MIYSKFGIVMMFIFSILGFCMGVKFINESWIISVIGFVLFIEATYIYIECIRYEIKWRKQNQKTREEKPVIILNQVKSKLKWEK